jgi:hypothetical protein
MAAAEEPRVIYSNHPFWCGHADSTRGPSGITLCGSTQELCMRALTNLGDGVGPCIEHGAMACFKWRRVVLDENNAFCFSTMTECLAGLETLTGPDLVATSKCFVMRHRQ